MNEKLKILTPIKRNKINSLTIIQKTAAHIEKAKKIEVIVLISAARCQ